jgi:O-antigen/teichoic acid export membrane protein
MSALASNRLGATLSALSQATLWVTVAVAAPQAATLLSNVAVANLLGPERFGIYGFAQTSLNTFASIAQLSLGLAATRFLPDWRTREPALAGEFLARAATFVLAFGLLLAAGFSGALAMFDGAAWSAQAFDAPVLLAFLVAIPLLALGLLQNGVFVGCEWFKPYALVSVVTAALSVAVPALGAHLLAVQGAICGLAIAILIRVIAGTVTILRKLALTDIRLNLQRSGTFMRTVRDFALPSSAGFLLASLAQWLAALLLLNSSGAGSFGLYVATLSVRQIVVFVPAQLAGVTLTHMSKRPEPELQRQVFRLSVVLTAIVAAVITGLCAIFAEQLLRLFGAGFAVGEVLLLTMLASAFVESVAVALYQVLPHRGRMWKSLTYVNIPRDGALLLLALFAIPRWGAVGLAAALLASQVIAVAGIVLAARSRT